MSQETKKPTQNQHQLWDYDKIHARIEVLLEEARQREMLLPPESGSQVVPASVALLYILETVKDGSFYGELSLKVKGIRFLSPEVVRQVQRMPRILDEYFNTDQ